MATASGGDGGSNRENRNDKDFHPLRRSGRPRYDRHLSRIDIGNQSRVLLTRFIHDRMEANGMPNAPNAEALIEPGTPTGPPVDHIQEVADALKRIGDELDGDAQLQRLIAHVPTHASKETFLSVAKDLFADGIFNWGRVVTLFYFAYKMAIKALESTMEVIPIVKSIIEWVVSFIIDFVAPWIIDRGGWEAIQEWFGATGAQMAAVIVSAVITSVLTVCYSMYKSS